MQPPRRELYELGQTLLVDSENSTADKGGFFMPKSDRRWHYLGPETHYGYTYHIWENDLTKGRYAWEVTAYRDAAIKETT